MYTGMLFRALSGPAGGRGLPGLSQSLTLTVGSLQNIAGRLMPIGYQKNRSIHLANVSVYPYPYPTFLWSNFFAQVYRCFLVFK